MAILGDSSEEEVQKARQSKADKYQSEKESAFAASGLDESYRNQFYATYDAYNPNSINDTFWDLGANFFGARSSADKMRMQIKARRDQEIANLIGVSREQKYNSEKEKADRMRAAGLNPDLQGLGQASEATESTELDPVDFSGLTTGADIAGSALNAVSTALSLFSGIQSLKANGIDIAAKELDLAQGSDSQIFNLLRTAFSKDMFDSYTKGRNDWSFQDTLPVLKSHLKKIGVRSSRAQKLVLQKWADLFGSYTGDILNYKSMKDYIDAQDSYASGASSWYRKNGMNSTDDDIIPALRDFNEMLHSVDVAYGNFSRKYYSLLDAGKKAAAENAANEFHEYSTNQKKKLYRKLMTNSKGKERSSMFSLLLATQLMGDSNALGQAAGAAGTFATPFLGNAGKLAAKAIF